MPFLLIFHNSGYFWGRMMERTKLQLIIKINSVRVSEGLKSVRVKSRGNGTVVSGEGPVLHKLELLGFDCIFWSSSPGFIPFLVLNTKLNYKLNSRFIINKIYLHSSTLKVKAFLDWIWTGNRKTNPLPTSVPGSFISRERRFWATDGHRKSTVSHLTCVHITTFMSLRVFPLGETL